MGKEVRMKLQFQTHKLDVDLLMPAMYYVDELSLGK